MDSEKKHNWDKNSKWPKELELLKSIANRTGLTETVKWGGIAYTYNGKNVIGIGGFNDFFTIWFFKGVFLKDDNKILVNAQEGVTKSLRQWRFTTKGEVNEKLVLAYINEAIEIEKAGLAVTPEKKPLIIPERLQAELDSSLELAKAFANFSPYKQKEFAEAIATAKQEKTLLARLEKIKLLILEGSGLNDKYR